jgi:hypothetical protein
MSANASNAEFTGANRVIDVLVLLRICAKKGGIFRFASSVAIAEAKVESSGLVRMSCRRVPGGGVGG